MNTQVAKIKSIDDLKLVLRHEYMKQIENFFGDQRKALEFLSNVTASVQRTPKLLECDPVTVVNSFMVMASLKLMPSGVSGEAYVLPYKNNGVMEAQFQLGYQGIVTLLYRAGNKEVVAELVREHDTFTLTNGKIAHSVDPRKTKEERGEVIGAYAIIHTPRGGTVEQYMTIKDIHAHAAKFSKSYNSSFTPWKKENDPEGWMPRKTVLKQAAKLAPKNEHLAMAIAEDNRDSIIGDRLDGALAEGKELTMGNLLKDGDKTKKPKASEGQDQAGGPAEGDQGTKAGE